MFLFKYKVFIVNKSKTLNDMGEKIFKGFKQVDGTAEGFSINDFEIGYIYFVRTDNSGEEGYLYFNGKKYGEIPDIIDCGTY